MGVCNCTMFCCTLLYVHFSIAIILMGNRELIALLNLSSWCLVMVERLFLTVPRGCLQFVVVVFPDHTHLLFLLQKDNLFKNILYHYFSLEMVAILLNDLMLLLRNRYNKYWQTMCLSWPKILISAQNN